MRFARIQGKNGTVVCAVDANGAALPVQFGDTGAQCASCRRSSPAARPHSAD